MNAIKISADSLAYFNHISNHTDEDLASSGNPYGIETESEDNSLNGIYGSFNHICVQIEGDESETPTITISAKESSKKVVLDGEDAKRALCSIREDRKQYGLRYAVYLNTYKYVF